MTNLTRFYLLATIAAVFVVAHIGMTKGTSMPITTTPSSSDEGGILDIQYRTDSPSGSTPPSPSKPSPSGPVGFPPRQGGKPGTNNSPLRPVPAR